jgi:Tfp pilus assembly protein PilO
MDPMLIIVLVIALVLIAGFFTVWKKDRDRTQEQTHDGGRLDP